MKIYQYLILLLLAVNSYAQDTYEFDHVIQYRYKFYTDTVNNNRHSHNFYRFVNSKNNTYSLTVWEYKNTVQMSLMLKDGKTYSDNIARADFFVEAISLKCPRVGMQNPKYSKDVKDYSFIKAADSVINTNPVKHLVFKPVDEKKLKKNKILTEHFLVDNKYNFSVPSLPNNSLAHKILTAGEKLPNGVVSDWYMEDAQGNKTEEVYLVDCIALKKIIIIDTNCK